MKQAFLVNAPKRRRVRKARKSSGVAGHTRKTSRRRTTARRKGVPAWVKAKGYSSWGAYMASIRPNRKGGKVATRKRRRRRASAARPVARRRRRRVVARSSPRRRRRSYARNPIGLRNITGMMKSGAVAAVGVLAGKAGARVGRSAMKISGGTPIGYAAEIAVGIAGGILLEKFVGRAFATNFLVGAFVSVGEQLAKNANIPVVSTALGDAGEGDLNLIGDTDDLSRYLSGGQGTYDPVTGGGREGVGGYDIGGYETAEA